MISANALNACAIDCEYATRSAGSAYLGCAEYRLKDHGDVSQNQIIESDCGICGQCITNVPQVLRERDDTSKVSALADPETITVVQVAPAVRAAWGGLDMPAYMATGRPDGSRAEK